MENGPELKFVARWSVQHFIKEKKLNYSESRNEDKHWKTLKVNLRIDVKSISRFVPVILWVDWKNELV